jgi:hypothetical protein
MAGILIILIIWAVFASGVGFVVAKIEQKVNNLREPRLKSAILLSVLLGPLGWIILAARSGMTFAGNISKGMQQVAPPRQDEIQR